MIDDQWTVDIESPLGPQKGVISLKQAGDTLTGAMTGSTFAAEVENGNVDGDTLTWSARIKYPLPMTLKFKAQIDRDMLSGTVDMAAFGVMEFSGKKV